MSGRFLILDQSLRDADGHHYEMSRHVALAAAALGLSPRVAAHRDFDTELPFGDTPVDPWFTQTWVDAHQSKAAQAVRRAIETLPPILRKPALEAAAAARKTLPRGDTATPPPFFGAEVAAYLRQHNAGPRDHAFIHTLAGGELWSLCEAIERLDNAPHTHVVLRRDATEPVMNKGAPGGLGGLFARIAETPALQACLRLYTDTEALTAQHAALHPGVTVQTLPIPIPPIISEVADAPRKPGSLRLVYLGNARTEKGFHALPAAMAALATRDVPPARLIAQANSAVSLNEAAIEAARRALRRAPDLVTLIETPLRSDAYDRLLAEADIVLLPYNPNDYRRRSSGILIQALAAGKPVVVPDRSWLADTAPHGASVRFKEYDDFAGAVVDAVQRFDALDAAAKAGAQHWRDTHSPRALVQTLLARG